MKVFFGVLIAINRYDLLFEQALESILLQEFNDFSIVVVVNGTLIDISLLEKYRLRNVNFVFTPLERLSFSLDLGLQNIDCEYLVRMDGDDISYPNRLRVMYDFIRDNNYPSVCGSWVQEIDLAGNHLRVLKPPCDNEAIRKMLPFSNPFCHPSVCIKKSDILKFKGYANGFKSEDYDLWVRMRRDPSIVFRNCSEITLGYRVGSGMSRGSRQSYAEVAGYRLREFLLHFSLANFAAFIVWSAKCIFLSKRV